MSIKEQFKPSGKKIIPNAEMLQCEVHQLKNGATVIDMGLFARGEYMAGKKFVEVDASIHTVACCEITNFKTGKTFRAGELREDMLARSFL